MQPSGYYGFYRAKVVDNNDPDNFSRVKVWIPHIMVDISESDGIWALPANNPIGGRNVQNNKKFGTSYIPPKDSWVWIFFENGNVNYPYYFAGLSLYNEENKDLPEIQEGSNKDKWVIFRSPDGRTIVVSDDPKDSRIEITGKKRNDDVYSIDGNQTTILLNEGENGEQVLIKTHNGIYLNIDVDDGAIYLNSTDKVVLASGSNLDLLAGGNVNLKSVGDITIQSSGNLNLSASGNVIISGSMILTNTGGAPSASSAKPKGDRK